MSEMDKLLQELRGMQNTTNTTIENSREIWEKIGNRDFVGAGFADEAEALKWIDENPYSNL